MLDLIVVGGGPAGLAAAIHARQCGMTVRVFEPKRTPIDKACGEGLMPPAIAALDQMGVERPQGVHFQGIRYVDGDHQAEGQFSDGPGLGVRRTELHRVLSNRVDELEIEVLSEAVHEWSQDNEGVTVFIKLLELLSRVDVNVKLENRLLAHKFHHVGVELANVGLEHIRSQPDELF